MSFSREICAGFPMDPGAGSCKQVPNFRENLGNHGGAQIFGDGQIPPDINPGILGLQTCRKFGIRTQIPHSKLGEQDLNPKFKIPMKGKRIFLTNPWKMLRALIQPQFQLLGIPNPWEGDHLRLLIYLIFRNNSHPI